MGARGKAHFQQELPGTTGGIRALSRPHKTRARFRVMRNPICRFGTQGSGILACVCTETKNLRFAEPTLQGLYRDNGKENGKYYMIQIMEKNMETTILYRGYI